MLPGTVIWPPTTHLFQDMSRFPELEPVKDTVATTEPVVRSHVALPETERSETQFSFFKWKSIRSDPTVLKVPPRSPTPV